MPDGNVGLILDVGGLVRLAQADSSARAHVDAEKILQATA
jgi:hypothetical protein